MTQQLQSIQLCGKVKEGEYDLIPKGKHANLQAELAKQEVINDFYLEGLEKSAKQFEQLQAENKQLHKAADYLLGIVIRKLDIYAEASPSKKLQKVIDLIRPPERR